jgi:hypothetical protein
MRIEKLVLIGVCMSCFFIVNKAKAQNVVISDDPSYTTAADGALLDVHSQNGNLGILIPASTDPTNISPAASGLLVFDSDDYSFYFYSNNTWVRLCGPSGISLTYGEMYHSLAALPQSVPGISAWIGLNGFQSGNSSGISFTNDDVNGDYLLIPSGGTGAYKVNVSLSASCSKNNNITEVGLFINAAANPEENAHILQELNQEGSTVSLTGIILCSEWDQIRIKMKANNAVDVLASSVNLVKLD